MGSMSQMPPWLIISSKLDCWLTLQIPWGVEAVAKEFESMHAGKTEHQLICFQSGFNVVEAKLKPALQVPLCQVPLLPEKACSPNVSSQAKKKNAWAYKPSKPVANFTNYSRRWWLGWRVGIYIYIPGWSTLWEW